jgi:hypothetical protein
LDVIFNFEKAQFVLDELIIGGEIQETSVRVGIAAVESADHIMLNEALSIVLPWQGGQGPGQWDLAGEFNSR